MYLALSIGNILVCVTAKYSFNVKYQNLQHTEYLTKTKPCKYMPVSTCMCKKCRRKCLSEREQTLLLRILKYYRKKYVNIFLKDIMVECEINSKQEHQRTVSRYLN